MTDEVTDTVTEAMIEAGWQAARACGAASRSDRHSMADDNMRTIYLAMRSASPVDTDCPSCSGLNTACPEGCGRDPETGELDGSTLASPVDGEVVERVRQQGQQEGFAAAIHQLRDLGAQKPRHPFAHEAERLADSLEASRIPGDAALTPMKENDRG